MTGVLKKSLASWREAHGYGILCVISLQGECFFVEPRPADRDQSGLHPWAAVSEGPLREQLAERGLSDSEIDDAIQLARDWATTTTGFAGFSRPAKST